MVLNGISNIIENDKNEISIIREKLDLSFYLGEDGFINDECRIPFTQYPKTKKGKMELISSKPLQSKEELEKKKEEKELLEIIEKKDIVARIAEAYKKLELTECSSDNLTCELEQIIKKDKEKYDELIESLKDICWMDTDRKNAKVWGKNAPDGIMIHEPGVGRKSKNPRDVAGTILGKGLSVHFIIDSMDGSIYSCMPLEKKASHCGACNQRFYLSPDNHCTSAYCAINTVPLNEVNYDDNGDPSGCTKRPASFNNEKIGIEICRAKIENKKPKKKENKKGENKENEENTETKSNDTENYQNKAIPAAVELCAWLCYIYGWDPLGRAEDTCVYLSKEAGADECNGNDDPDGMMDIIENTAPYTIITHREGHLFYRKTSVHRDSDSFWGSTCLDETNKSIFDTLKTKEETKHARYLAQEEKRRILLSTNEEDQKKYNKAQKNYEKAIKLYKEAIEDYNNFKKKKEEEGIIFKAIIITTEMLEHIDKEMPIMGNLVNKQLVPKYFRILVNEKLKIIKNYATKFNESADTISRNVIEKFCNPMLWLLIPYEKKEEICGKGNDACINPPLIPVDQSN